MNEEDREFLEESKRVWAEPKDGDVPAGKRIQRLLRIVEGLRKENDSLRDDLDKARQHITLMNNSWPRPR